MILYSHFDFGQFSEFIMGKCILITGGLRKSPTFFKHQTGLLDPIRGLWPLIHVKSTRKGQFFQ